MKAPLFVALALAIVVAPAFSIAAHAQGALQSLVQFGAQDVYILPKDCVDAGLTTQKDCDALHAGAGKTPAATVEKTPVLTDKSAGTTAQACQAEYAANKVAIKAAGESKRKFLSQCLAGTEVIPTASTAGAEPVATTAAPTTSVRPTSGLSGLSYSN